MIQHGAWVGGFNIDTDSFNVGLNYAYVNYNILDFTHQFGIDFKFLKDLLQN